MSTPLFDRGSTCGGCFELRCVDHILWCLQGSPATVVTVTDFCPPNYGLPGDYGGWCNHPREHFEMSESAFAEIAATQADIVPVQYRRSVEATEPVAPLVYRVGVGCSISLGTHIGAWITVKRFVAAEPTARGGEG